MTPSKILYYCIEFFCCYATVFYSNFLFFYMKSAFGFGALENLLLAALNGLVYTFAAWQGGLFAQRHGCIRSLYLGILGMALSLAAGLIFHTAPAQVIVFGLWTVSVCFVWPALEALISKDGGDKLPDLVGWYNVIWAGGGAIAYFTAGMFLERFGMQSLFKLPLLLLAVPLALVMAVTMVSRSEKKRGGAPPPMSGNHRPPDAKRFLHMAWLANPLSYVAINTLIPLIPSISSKLVVDVCPLGGLLTAQAMDGMALSVRLARGGLRRHGRLFYRAHFFPHNHAFRLRRNRFRLFDRAYLLLVAVLFDERLERPRYARRAARGDDRLRSFYRSCLRGRDLFFPAVGR